MYIWISIKLQQIELIATHNSIIDYGSRGGWKSIRDGEGGRGNIACHTVPRAAAQYPMQKLWQ
jgi:hypothetical protein